jgi:hypothetical protein
MNTLFAGNLVLLSTISQDTGFVVDTNASNIGIGGKISQAQHG